jgi:molybdopterin converting factor small subunit
MRVRVQYLAQLKRVLGTNEETVEVPGGCTLAQLVRQLAARPDAAARSRLLDPAGGPSRSLLFFVDDALADATRVLHDGAVITVLAPMAGG